MLSGNRRQNNYIYRSLQTAGLLIVLATGSSFSQASVQATKTNQRPILTVIGIDAAEWGVINFLRSRGELPTLDRWIKEGASGELESIHPMFTPIVWTTIATGKTPLEHGIRGFKLLNPDTGHKVPVNRTMRRTKAMWNILSDRGLRSLVVAWYATWPAEKVRGNVVSDYTWPLKNSDSSEHFLEEKAGLAMKEQTYPSYIYKKLKPYFIDKYKENDIFSKRFAISVKDSPYALKHSYAKDLTYFRIYRRLRKAARYDLSTLYIQGPDLLSHKFFEEFSALKEGRISLTSLAGRRANLIIKYYQFVDQLLDVYDKTIRGPNETVMLVSDHGFEDKKETVLTKVSDDKFAKKRYWHRKQGLLIAHGPQVSGGTKVEDATVFDIAPTVLSFFGLPVSQDMPGSPIAAILGVSNKTVFDRIASYDETVLKGKSSKHTIKDGTIRESSYDSAIIKRLNDLGYIQ